MSPQDAGMSPHIAGVTAMGGGARFFYAACRGLAAVVRLVPAGTAVDMGPPIGAHEQGRDGVLIDQWLGGPSWQAVDLGTWARIGELMTAIRPDPGALHAVSWELAPFCCRGCQRCYCSGHWQCAVILDGGFYDYTDGVCPAGHRQMIDD